jgi:hypothetical protein
MFYGAVALTVEKSRSGSFVLRKRGQGSIFLFALSVFVFVIIFQTVREKIAFPSVIPTLIFQTVRGKMTLPSVCYARRIP